VVDEVDPRHLGEGGHHVRQVEILEVELNVPGQTGLGGKVRRERSGEPGDEQGERQAPQAAPFRDGEGAVRRARVELRWTSAASASPDDLDQTSPPIGTRRSTKLRSSGSVIVVAVPEPRTCTRGRPVGARSPDCWMMTRLPSNWTAPPWPRRC
jgi:hypothetical protein